MTDIITESAVNSIGDISVSDMLGGLVKAIEWVEDKVMSGKLSFITSGDEKKKLAWQIFTKLLEKNNIKVVDPKEFFENTGKYKAADENGKELAYFIGTSQVLKDMIDVICTATKGQIKINLPPVVDEAVEQLKKPAKRKSLIGSLCFSGKGNK
jgi:hypothetical protein